MNESYIEKITSNMISYAKERIGSTDYNGWCLSFIEDALEKSNDIEIFGGSSARESYDMYIDGVQKGIPEKGSFVFYDCLCQSEDGLINYGHCGIALEEGKVIHAFDKVRIDNYLDIEELTSNSGNHPKYLGWVKIERVLKERRSMNIKLVKLSEEYKDQFFEMMDEWSEYNNTHKDANRSPSVIFRNDYHDFENYMNNLETKEAKNGLVKDSTFFCLDIDRNKFVGAANIRHELNEGLLFDGGHIGDGIRPSERNKGYGVAMVKLALEECKKLGIDKVLMVCDKDNIGSKKTIVNNGGILENEVMSDEGVPEERYWITLSKAL